MKKTNKEILEKNVIEGNNNNVFNFITKCSIFGLELSFCLNISKKRDRFKTTKQGRKPDKHETFIKKLEKINSDVEVLGKYVHSLEKIKVRCKTCGNVWYVTPHNLLLGRGCPECWRHRIGKHKRLAAI